MTMNSSVTFPLDKIAKPLLKWFRARARSLPWRDDPRPYFVWISEIMLQQTRVAAVMPYFSRFVAALPNVASLAAADDDALMKLWEGLGYYSRARNLKKAAQVVMEKHGGVIPDDFDQLLALPGVGRYTAGAIASIAYGKRVPAVDGNVLRVVARLTASREDVLREKTKRAVEDALASVMPKDAGQFNQAMMELGALVCLPRAAHCGECPLAGLCRAHAEGIENELPVKAMKKERRVEPRTVLLIERDGKFAIAKRPKRGLLAELWEFPNLTGEKKRAELLALCKNAGLSVKSARRMKAARHIFTHIEWRLTGWHIRLDETAESVREERAAYGNSPLPHLTWATREELSEIYGIPAAFHAYMPSA
ncbi:MAG: A/G-specific adenine glycosylase [Schwartzia sp.]|nr:A/G-specific adenine glycosylase [Schwartzia sp. (in: firmicutes)]